jgi:hypothetical protein
MEYLLTHGPVQFVVEFRVDKEQVEELTRFVFIDENMYVSDSRLIVKLWVVFRSFKNFGL